MAPPLVFEQVGRPEGREAAHAPRPHQIVGEQPVAHTAERGVAPLRREGVVARGGGARRREGELVAGQVLHEDRVEVVVDGRAVDLVAAHRHGLLARREGRAQRRAPGEVDPVGGVEQIAVRVVELVDPQAEVVGDGRADAPFETEVEVLAPQSREGIAALGRLVRERGAHL